MIEVTVDESNRPQPVVLKVHNRELHYHPARAFRGQVEIFGFTREVPDGMVVEAIDHDVGIATCIR